MVIYVEADEAWGQKSVMLILLFLLLLDKTPYCWFYCFITFMIFLSLLKFIFSQIHQPFTKYSEFCDEHH